MREADSLSFLEAALDATADGILVVDVFGQIVRYNRRFARMWGISPATLSHGDDNEALKVATSKVRDPDTFTAKVRELYDHPTRKSLDTIELTDGRVFERYSRPYLLDNAIAGRVWSFRDVTQQTRARAALKESEERYRRLFEDSRQPIYLTSRDGYFLAANPAALALFNFTEEEMTSHNAQDFYVDPAARESFRKEVERSGSVLDYPVRLKDTQGAEMECLLSSSVWLGESGEILGYQGIIDNITEKERAELAVRESEQKFRSLIEHASDTITLIDGEGIILYESPSVHRVLGYHPEELVGRRIFDYLHPSDLSQAFNDFRSIMSAPDNTARTEVRFRHRDGYWRALEAVARNLLHDPSVKGIVINARDVTERKEAEARLVHDALHDKLTKLPNRALLMDRLGLSLKRATREPHTPFAVLFLDFDRFKVVNDSLGHMVGDQLLMAVARCLQDNLRPGDTVARLGGDEFTMLLEDANRDVAVGVAQRVQEALNEPFLIGEHEVFMSASIGIAMSSSVYRHPEEILRDADLAMYKAKEKGRGLHEVFHTGMHHEAVSILRLETDLRHALDRREFELFYQPIVWLNDGSLYAFEALLRWNHPERGFLHPVEFLQTAEDTDLIIPIGWWVMEEVARTVAEWTRDPAVGRPIPVQVNVASRQFSSPDIVARVKDTLQNAGAPGNLLHLELTESSMMENAESTVGTLRELKSLDVGLSIDDFGTGYSSLSYLHRFPTDSVKIDRSFVARVNDSPRDRGLIRTIVDLGHDLGMRVVAEGVESSKQAEALSELHCECAQGYFYSAPVSRDEATEYLRRGRTW